MTATGIDISSYSGNWNAQKTRDAGFEFATIRAATWDLKPLVDRNFETNYLKAEKAGLWRWVYAWTNPRAPLTPQADLFTTVCKGAEPELGYLLDLEDYKTCRGWRGVMSAYRAQWLEPVAAAVQQTPAIYVNKSYADSYFVRPTKISAGDLWLMNYPLCIASWGGIAPSIPWPWLPGQWAAWQCTNDKTSGPHFGLESQECTLYISQAEMY